jgi:hypothetical protein
MSWARIKGKKGVSWVNREKEDREVPQGRGPRSRRLRGPSGSSRRSRKRKARGRQRGAKGEGSGFGRGAWKGRTRSSAEECARIGFVVRQRGGKGEGQGSSEGMR